MDWQPWSLRCRLGWPPATAEQAAESSDVLAQVAPKVLRDAPGIAAMQAANSAHEFERGGKSVVVPEDPSRQMTVTENGSTVGITVPFAEQASDAGVTKNDQPMYDNNNGSKTAPHREERRFAPDRNYSRIQACS